MFHYRTMSNWEITFRTENLFEIPEIITIEPIHISLFCVLLTPFSDVSYVSSYFRLAKNIFYSEVPPCNNISIAFTWNKRWVVSNVQLEEIDTIGCTILDFPRLIKCFWRYFLLQDIDSKLLNAIDFSLNMARYYHSYLF